jgi:hypothetical protein
VHTQAVVSSIDALLILVFLIIIALILYSTMVHFAERGDVFVKTSVGGPNRGWLKYHKDGTVSQPPFWSVSRSMWWCIATLTTVGYGDETPQTNSGKIIGAFTMVSGILIIALPVSVLGTNFSVAYQKAVDVKGEKRGCDTSVKCHVLCVWEQYTNERLLIIIP